MQEKDTMRGDRTRDQSIKSRTLYRTELARLVTVKLGDWSSGMILASGARGREFDSRITPFLFGAKNSESKFRSWDL